MAITPPCPARGGGLVKPRADMARPVIKSFTTMLDFRERHSRAVPYNGVALMSHSTVTLLACSMILVRAAAPAQDADRNFTGTWKLDEQRSRVDGLPQAPGPLLRIKHQGLRLQCVSSGRDGSEDITWLTTDGKSARNKTAARHASSMSKWEGSALLINTLVNEPENYAEMDRWKLSKDCNTLVIRRQVVRGHHEIEATLVYNRVMEPSR